MAKARTCRRCKWREHKVEPCCWCRRLHKEKKDDYFQEDETVEKEFTSKELIEMLNHCSRVEADCDGCALGDEDECCSKLSLFLVKKLEQLEQELIDERDRYDRLVSFELCEAKELAARKLRQREEAFLEEQRRQRDEYYGGNLYWQRISRMNAAQEEKGLAKYGQALEENVTLSRTQRIEHAQEELIDALKYLEHLKAVAGNELSANDYQRMAMRTNDETMSEFDMLRNAVYGMNGEAGEIIDLLKKHEFQGHDLDLEELIEECGDILWYCALFATALREDLQTIMERNIEKLKDRYPEGFDKARSINREG